MYFQKIAVPLLKNEACLSYGHSKLVHTSKFRQNLEILNGCNSETIQVQGLKFHANSSHRVRYVLTKFWQNLWRVSILRVDLTWNDPYAITEYMYMYIIVLNRAAVYVKFLLGENFCQFHYLLSLAKSNHANFYPVLKIAWGYMVTFTTFFSLSTSWLGLAIKVFVQGHLQY